MVGIIYALKLPHKDLFRSVGGVGFVYKMLPKSKKKNFTPQSFKSCPQKSADESSVSTCVRRPETKKNMNTAVSLNWQQG